MSIIIKGMDMPKDCSYCILANEHINGLCEKKYYCRLEADYEHCPLIEIPKGFDYTVLKFIEAIQKAEDERRADEHTD